LRVAHDLDEASSKASAVLLRDDAHRARISRS